MIENFNDFISIAVLVVVLLASIIGFYKFNRSFKKEDKSDEYYRDLL